MPDQRWQQIEQLYHAALEHDSASRAAFLAKACAGDDELRREIEELLRYDEETRGFLQGNALEAAAENIKTRLQASAPSLAGRQLGAYKIIEALGKGGMGEVYLAKDVRLERRVALKLLPEEATQQKESLARFEQEAKAVSALNHPNILTIYEFGTAATSTGETYFLASEFIDGETLRQRMQSARLSLRETLDIAVQMAQALAAAHEARIIHRDIKPENVMIRQDGIVKILDFGLAKLTPLRNADFGLWDETPDSMRQTGADAPHSPAPQLTTPGTIIGTIAYMSPEQASGREVDARTDVFSLGVVLYEMLAQRRPFSGATASHTIVAILENDPPPLPPDVPAEIADLLKRMLAKRANARPANAQALLADLKQLQKQFAAEPSLRPSGAPAPVPITQLSPVPAAMSRKLWLSIGLILLACAVGYFGYRALTARRVIQSIAVMPFVNASGNPEIEYLSDGMTEELIRHLSQLSNVSVKARSSVFRYKGKEIAPQAIGQELNVQALLHGRVLQREGQLKLSLELIDAQTENVLWSAQYERQATNAVTLQSEIARDVSSNLQAKVTGADAAKVTETYTINPEAWQLYLKGRFALNKGTAAGQKESVGYFRQAVTHDPKFALGYTGMADAYTLLGTVYNVQMDLDEAMRNARIACEKAIEINPNLSEAWTSLAWIKFRFDWDWPGAEQDFKKAIALDPKSAHAHHWYAEFLSCMGRHEQATAEMKIARDLEPFSLIINWNLGKNLANAGQFDEALAECNRVKEMDPSFARVYRTIRQIYMRKGMEAEAFGALEREWEFNRATPAQLALLRDTYKKYGFQRAFRLRAELDLQNADRDKMTAYNRVNYFLMLGDKEKALDWLERGYIDRNGSMVGVYSDHAFQILHNEPRYQAIIQKMKFPQ